MNQYIAVGLLTILLFSCKDENEQIVHQRMDYLSQWFTANEDSLYNEFHNLVKTTSLCNKCDSNWGEKAFTSADSTKYMGRFTLEAKKYCDSLQVTFFYKRSATPNERILISTDYNKKFTKAIDTIFNPVPASKHFTLLKYEQPDLETSGFSLPNLNIYNKDLKVSFTPKDDMFNLTVFIYSKNLKADLDVESKDILKKQLFGEELLLKKINKIDFIITDSLNPKLSSFDSVRSKLLREVHPTRMY